MSIGPLIIGNAQTSKYGDYIVTEPLCFEAALRRAHQRTFNLQAKLARLQKLKDRDKEVDQIVSEASQPLFEPKPTAAPAPAAG